MKPARPRIPVQLASATVKMVIDEGDLEDSEIVGQDGTNSVVSGLGLSGTVFDKVLLTGALFERLAARDVIFKGSDFSGVNISSGAVNRGEFTSCRLSGTDFNKTELHDVVFRGCKMDMTNFRFGDLRRVTFIDCTLSETDFMGAILQNVSFESCTLEKVVFDRAKCKNVDFRTSDLYELSGWNSLKGSTIDHTQLVAAAPYLAHELGITIK